MNVRVTSPDDLTAIRKRVLAARDPQMPRIVVCGGTGCRANGSLDVAQAFGRELAKSGLSAKVVLKMSGCHGFCQQGPVVVIEPQGIFYRQVGRRNVDRDVRDIVKQTISRGKIVDRLVYEHPRTAEKLPHYKDIPFYSKQVRIALKNNGVIDPNDLSDYIAVRGYEGLAKALSMAPEEVIGTITNSGLRGRGGGGFPTGRKWGLCRGAPDRSIRYIICNADEGDPGAFMDRSIMEGDPHAVLEGMCIGAYSMSGGICGAEGYIYIRAEYPLAVANVRLALEAAEEAGVLGDNVMGSGFSFHVKVKEGAGAFVCGEETALIASVEGRRGAPRPRPPFPANEGLFGKPSNINNVETWANVPKILDNGAEWYASIGTEKSKGTKVFSLVGKVRNSGLVEVPMGISLREIVFDMGGGIPGDKKIKGVQTGGPSGGCIPAEFLDMPVDYEALAEKGSIMGSGGMVVMDEDTCMVDIARYFLEFTRAESCGKCVPCRVGTAQMHSTLQRIVAGKGRPEDIDLLEELGQNIKATALCGLGQTAPNPVLTALRYFRHEYEEHVNKHKCRAVVCKQIVEAPCKHTCPANVDVPRYVRYVAQGRYTDALNVVRERIPFPFVCGRVCFHPCETRCRRGQVDEPIAIRALKRVATDLGGPVRNTSARGRNDRRVAVVGSGPCGLTAGYYLKNLGYRVTVYEALDRAGGMMWSCIPDYRLPPKVLNREIDSLGLEIVLGHTVRSIEGLRKHHDAVVIATGAHHGVTLGIPGDSSDGVIDCTDFLRAVNAGRKIRTGHRVIVIGGGNAAIDAARVAVRQGAKHVAIAYRRDENQMPATRDEVEEALREKIRFSYLAAPTRIRRASGELEVTFVRMELGQVDTSGRPRPVPIDGSEFTMAADMVISAIGQKPTVPAVLSGLVDRRGRLKVDPETGMTGMNGVFSGGDVVLGPSSVIESIAQGRELATSIDRHFGGSGDIAEVFAPAESWEDAEPPVPSSGIGRARTPTVALSKRTPKCEVELCLSRPAARREAGRCLNCDLEE